jgi:hypothetical protein
MEGGYQAGNRNCSVKAVIPGFPCRDHQLLPHLRIRGCSNKRPGKIGDWIETGIVVANQGQNVAPERLAPPAVARTGAPMQGQSRRLLGRNGMTKPKHLTPTETQ